MAASEAIGTVQGDVYESSLKRRVQMGVLLGTVQGDVYRSCPKVIGGTELSKDISTWTVPDVSEKCSRHTLALPKYFWTCKPVLGTDAAALKVLCRTCRPMLGTDGRPAIGISTWTIPDLGLAYLGALRQL